MKRFLGKHFIFKGFRVFENALDQYMVEDEKKTAI